MEKRKSSKPTDSGDNNVMDMQLSMTLVVGFVLLFVNIIAFAIVSYRKEKDKYKIEVISNRVVLDTQSVLLFLIVIAFAIVLYLSEKDENKIEVINSHCNTTYPKFDNNF